MPHRLAPRRAAASALLAVAVLSAAACGSSQGAHSASGGGGIGSPGAAKSASQGMSDMDMGSMDGIPTAPAIAEAAPRGDGLAASYGGYVYLPAAGSVPANTPAQFDFHITGPDDHALTRYQPYESKLVVVYLLRADATGFEMLDPTMRQDGTWTVGLPALAPGSYRTYVTFAAPDSSAGTPLLYALSAPLSVPGAGAAAAAKAPQLAPAPSVTTDGYALKLSGVARAGATSQLALDVTKDGKPVVYFQRYLDGYAHLAAFHVGDGAFAHVLSTGRAGGTGTLGPLTAQTVFSESGTWRVFVQFETGGSLHQAAFTVNVP